MWACEDKTQGVFNSYIGKFDEGLAGRVIYPIFLGGIPLLAIGYKCNFRKVLGFISAEGAGSTEPGDTYLSSFTVSVCSTIHHHFLCKYFNACNAIDNHNMMRQSDLVLEKYWVTQSGYFRLTTTVALGMSVIDGKLL